MSNRYFGIDFGGTFLRVAEVNPETGIVPGTLVVQDITSLTNNIELTALVESMIPRGCAVGISAAGDTDEEELIVKQSPNSHIKTAITFARDLRDRGHQVSITNDMKAAAQGAARFGEGKGHRNVLVATYSSGYNCAVVRTGVNASTAEFGHQLYKRDADLFCGCGERGHLEIYVSGNGAASMAQQFFLMTHHRDHLILRSALDDYNAKAQDAGELTYVISDLSTPRIHTHLVGAIGAKHVYQAYRAAPTEEPQRAIHDTQVHAIAQSFGMMVSAFNPLDVMVLMGSQTKDWDILFKPAIALYQQGGFQIPSLPKPPILKTELTEIGVVGAVAYLLNQSSLK